MSGVLNLLLSSAAAVPLNVEYLVVAGGGGGGTAGGGAGGFRTGTQTSLLINTPYAVSVGAGGPGSGIVNAPPNNGAFGTNGSPSEFNGIKKPINRYIQ